MGDLARRPHLHFPPPRQRPLGQRRPGDGTGFRRLSPNAPSPPPSAPAIWNSSIRCATPAPTTPGSSPTSPKSASPLSMPAPSASSSSTPRLTSSRCSPIPSGFPSICPRWKKPAHPPTATTAGPVPPPSSATVRSRSRDGTPARSSSPRNRRPTGTPPPCGSMRFVFCPPPASTPRSGPSGPASCTSPKPSRSAGSMFIFAKKTPRSPSARFSAHLFLPAAQRHPPHPRRSQGPPRALPRRRPPHN